MTREAKARKIIEQRGICANIKCNSSESNSCPCLKGCTRSIDSAQMEDEASVFTCQKFLAELRATSDPVNHPDHYTSGGIECIGAIRASMSEEAFKGFLKANVIKYMWRYEKKEKPLEDIKKAYWYLNKLIGELE
jgi:hypothetical protein